MDHTGILFFLCLCILVLCGIVSYQQFAFRTGTQAKLRSIHEKLREIADTDSRSEEHTSELQSQR